MTLIPAFDGHTALAGGRARFIDFRDRNVWVFFFFF